MGSNQKNATIPVYIVTGVIILALNDETDEATDALFAELNSRL